MGLKRVGPTQGTGVDSAIGIPTLVVPGSIFV